MKGILESCIFASVLFQSAAYATTGEPAKEVAKCASSYLFKQFMPGHGNRYYYSHDEGQKIYLKELDSEGKGTVAFIPGWSARSEQVGTAETREGRRDYQTIQKLQAVSKLLKTDHRIDVDYYHWSNLDSDNISVKLALPKGVPYLVAQEKMTESCSVDSWGRRTCAGAVYTYSDFQVKVPDTYTTEINWINVGTGLGTAYKVQTHQYRACLEGI